MRMVFESRAACRDIDLDEDNNVAEDDETNDA